MGDESGSISMSHGCAVILLGRSSSLSSFSPLVFPLAKMSNATDLSIEKITLLHPEIKWYQTSERVHLTIAFPRLPDENAVGFTFTTDKNRSTGAVTIEASSPALPLVLYRAMFVPHDTRAEFYSLGKAPPFTNGHLRIDDHTRGTRLSNVWQIALVKPEKGATWPRLTHGESKPHPLITLDHQKQEYLDQDILRKERLDKLAKETAANLAKAMEAAYDRGERVKLDFAAPATGDKDQLPVFTMSKEE